VRRKKDLRAWTREALSSLEKKKRGKGKKEADLPREALNLKGEPFFPQEKKKKKGNLRGSGKNREKLTLPGGKKT